MSRTVVSTPGGWTATTLLSTFVVSTGAAVASGMATRTALTIVLALMVLACLAAALFGGPAAPLAAGLAIAVAAGLIRGVTAVPGQGADTIDGQRGTGPVTIVGTVRESVAPAPAGRLIVDATQLSSGEVSGPISGAVLVQLAPGAPATFGPGDAVQITARRLSAPGRRAGPRSADALDRLRASAIASGATVTLVSVGGANLAGILTVVRARLADGIDAALPEPAAALLLGIAFGLRRPISADLTAQLQDAGLFHIVVVSGLKVIIVAGLVRSVAGALAWPRRRRTVLIAGTVAAYVLVSGAGPAAVRAAAMALMALVLNREGRRVDPLPMLSLIAAVMIGLDPHLYSDVGFLLSFIGTAGILLLADPLARRLPGPRLLVEPFAVTVAASAVTVPVMAGTFGVVSLIGPVANALALPLLPPLIVLGGAGAVASLAGPWPAWVPLQLAGAGVDGIVLVAHASSALPGAAIHVGEWPRLWTVAELTGVAAATAAFLLAHPVPRTRTRVGAAVAAGVLSSAAVLMAASAPDGRLRVTVLDVGAGPAVLVRTGDGGVALVDGGSDPARLLTALGRVLPPTAHTIDVVVMTGGDRGAIAALGGVPGRYSVTQVIAPDQEHLGTGGLAVVDGLRAAGANTRTFDGRPWRWSGADWECLAVGEPTPGGPACALRVSAGDGSVLVLGTMAPAEQEELAAVDAGRLGSDLVVTQPGTAAPALLQEVHPREVATPTSTTPRGSSTATLAAGARTGTDGDLQYAGDRAGLRRL